MIKLAVSDGIRFLLLVKRGGVNEQLIYIGTRYQVRLVVDGVEDEITPTWIFLVSVHIGLFLWACGMNDEVSERGRKYKTPNPR